MNWPTSEGSTPDPEDASGSGDRPLAPHFPYFPGEVQEQFPDLEVREFLGAGSMGAVFRVWIRRPDGSREVQALKVLPDVDLRDPAVADRFRREYGILAKCRHPNIVSLRGTGRTLGGWLYILMDYVPGQTLAAMLAAGPLPRQRMKKLVPQLFAGVAHAHGIPVVHRDLKPANILVSRSGLLKIADFGLAITIAGGEADTGLTASGAGLGTPGYMAPEQMRRAHRVDCRADIYSLGVILYQMLTGQSPSEGMRLPSAISAEFRPFDAVISRAMEHFPERRFTTVREMAASVLPLLDTGVQRRRRVIAGAAAVMIAASAGTVWIHYGRTQGAARDAGRNRFFSAFRSAGAALAAGTATSIRMETGIGDLVIAVRPERDAPAKIMIESASASLLRPLSDGQAFASMNGELPGFCGRMLAAAGEVEVPPSMIPRSLRLQSMNLPLPGQSPGTLLFWALIGAARNIAMLVPSASGSRFPALTFDPLRCSSFHDWGRCLAPFGFPGSASPGLIGRIVRSWQAPSLVTSASLETAETWRSADLREMLVAAVWQLFRGRLPSHPALAVADGAPDFSIQGMRLRSPAEVISAMLSERPPDVTVHPSIDGFAWPEKPDDPVASAAVREFLIRMLSL